MEANEVSKTALACAFMRAYHAAHDHPKIFDDPLAQQMVPQGARGPMEELFVQGFQELEPERARSCPDRESALRGCMQASAAPALILSRSRYAEDILAKVASEGVRQYVIIGAGLDSFALRRPASLGHLQVFEVDGPGTQALKRQLLLAGGGQPRELHLVPLDFSRERLDVALASAGYDPRAPTFFALLGVTYYLRREDLRGTLDAISDLAPAGSSVVFDYLDVDALGAGRMARRVRMLMEDLRAMGEPWITGLDPAGLAAELAPVGLRLQENLAPADIEARYFHGRKDGYHACEHIHFAWSMIT